MLLREIRIYQPGDYQVGEQLELGFDAGQHLGVVLRKQPNDVVTLFCGDNREFSAVIVAVHKKKVQVKIIAERVDNRESHRVIHLAQAISKGDRMEMVVQKAVELGVSSIIPLITQRCALKLTDERLQKKQAQWQAIAIAACEQSGRNRVPVVQAAMSFTDYLLNTRAALKFVLYPEAKKSWRDYEFASHDIGLVIGPEGGFCDEEISQLLANDFMPLGLGPRVLRTETAAIVALSVLQAVCGDL